MIDGDGTLIDSVDSDVDYKQEKQRDSFVRPVCRVLDCMCDLGAVLVYMRQ